MTITRDNTPPETPSTGHNSVRSSGYGSKEKDYDSSSSNDSVSSPVYASIINKSEIKNQHNEFTYDNINKLENNSSNRNNMEMSRSSQEENFSDKVNQLENVVGTSTAKVPISNRVRDQVILFNKNAKYVDTVEIRGKALKRE